MTSTTAHPEEVTLYPVMALRAARRGSGVGGGYRLYVFAKALDREQGGRGKIALSDLSSYARGRGVSPAQFRRWMGEARSNDLLSECQSQGGEWMLILPSDARAAYALGCQTLGNSKVRMAAGDLIGPGWKARIQAAYIATTRARPIKRLTMRKLTGVSQRTQRYREVQAGVKRTVNYCKSEYPADLLQAFQEFSPHRGIFVTRDNKLAWRLPDIRETDLAERIGRGRVRKANATLHRLQHQSGSLELQRALSDAVGPEIAGSESVTVRLFNSTPEELAKTERKLRKGYGQDVREVYVFSHMSAGGSRMWSRRE